MQVVQCLSKSPHFVLAPQDSERHIGPLGALLSLLPKCLYFQFGLSEERGGVIPIGAIIRTFCIYFQYLINQIYITYKFSLSIQFLETVDPPSPQMWNIFFLQNCLSSTLINKNYNTYYSKAQEIRLLDEHDEYRLADYRLTD